MPVFLFTDIEGSTKRWEDKPDAMSKALASHDSIVSSVISDYGGRIVKHTGDGFFAVFDDGLAWAACAVEIQKNIAEHDWEGMEPLGIRIGAHAGHAVDRGGDFFGRAVNRAQRVMSAAAGGQILLTKEAGEATALPEGGELRDLGVHTLRDLETPQRLFDLVHPDMPVTEFPPLVTLSAIPNNLPSQFTPFIGRGELLERIRSTLNEREKRLVTLLGHFASPSL